MSTSRLLLATAFALGVAASAVRAAEPAASVSKDTELDILLDTLRANRKALIAVNLQLSNDEAAKFWPLYDRYQKELSAVADRVVALVQDYEGHFRDMADEKALQLTEAYLSTEADRLKVRTSYLPEFAKILPGRTVARFYQIENKIDAVIRYDLASTIPVIDEERGTPTK